MAQNRFVMKKAISILSLAFAMVAPTSVKADEGMWLPSLVEKNMAAMTELGFKLTADDVYNINHACLKDAIIALDGGSCTASFVSSEGLIMTNHHCGYDEIQSHSTVENNLLANGFFAKSKDEELPNPGKTAWLLVRIEDVTSRILDSMPDDVPFEQRLSIVDSISEVIISEAVGGTNYEADVYDMFYDNAYYLFVYEVFKDVRLVAAPPESEGKYGADTDNWMWPRHTCDFSMFRVYCAPDGSPAEYSEENVPYHPKYSLPISLDGYAENDFTLVMGYPGSTERYVSSWEVEQMMGENVIREKVRGAKQSIWKEYMDADEKVRIQYSAKFASSSNYWKYSIGENRGVKRLHVIEKKRNIEDKFMQWVNADEARKLKYGNALNMVESSTALTDAYEKAYSYITENQMQGCEAIYFAIKNRKSIAGMAVGKKADSTLLKHADDFFKDYSATVDRHVTKAMIKMYLTDVDAEFLPTYMSEASKVGIDKFVDNMFERSIFCSQEKFLKFVKKPNASTISKDPIYKVAQSIFDTYSSVTDHMEYASLYDGMRLFVGGMMEMNPDSLFYSDANSTMRLTYGTISGYKPADAVSYDYWTTLDGVMEKEDTSVREFNVSPRLKELYAKKDYGRYGNADGTLNVCFLTDNDITGGNSGSPVINANGELIGLAFDGNWEAMSGDIAFERGIQKCIAVDIRYVLLMIDKFAGAQNLVDELTLKSSKN